MKSFFIFVGLLVISGLAQAGEGSYDCPHASQPKVGTEALVSAEDARDYFYDRKKILIGEIRQIVKRKGESYVALGNLRPTNGTFPGSNTYAEVPLSKISVEVDSCAGNWPGDYVKLNNPYGGGTVQKIFSNKMALFHSSYVHSLVTKPRPSFIPSGTEVIVQVTGSSYPSYFFGKAVRSLPSQGKVIIKTNRYQYEFERVAGEQEMTLQADLVSPRVKCYRPLNICENVALKAFDVQGTYLAEVKKVYANGLMLTVAGEASGYFTSPFFDKPRIFRPDQVLR